MRVHPTPMVWLLLLVPVLVSPFHVQAQAPNVAVRHLSSDDGLPDNTITAILQDRYGFMWFGTANGLAKYDGYTFTVYKNHPTDSHSLSMNRVIGLAEDRTGFLWVATRDAGINRFDRHRNQFIRYGEDHGLPPQQQPQVLALAPDQSLWVGLDSGLLRYDAQQDTMALPFQNSTLRRTLSTLNISALYWRTPTDLWIGTNNGGVFRLNPEHEELAELTSDAIDLQAVEAHMIYEDREGYVWIAGDNAGALRIDPTTSAIHAYLPKDRGGDLEDDDTSVVFEDKESRLWVGTRDRRLSWYDAMEDRFVALPSVERKHADSRDAVEYISKLRTAYADQAGAIWLGTDEQGLFYLEPSSSISQPIRHQPNAPHTLPENDVLAFLEDADGFLWFGMRNKGLSRYNPTNGTFRHFEPDPSNPNSLAYHHVYALHQDHQGTIWIGFESKVLQRFDPLAHTFTSYTRADGLAHERVYDLLEDQAGTLWVATRRGLSRYDAQEDRFYTYSNAPSDSMAVLGERIRVLHQGPSGTLWVGTDLGLNRYDPLHDAFVRYYPKDERASHLSYAEIRALYQDPDGILWIGTRGGGLNRFDPATETFTYVSRKEGLQSDIIYGILPDDEGNLWLSMELGMARYTPSTGSVRNYTTQDGLRNERFEIGAYYRTRDGRLLLGGPNGVDVITPPLPTDDTFTPPVYLTQLSIFNETYAAPRDLAELHHLALPHDQNFLTFTFAALDYASPLRNQYRYILEGFSPQWQTATSERQATYTNLSPGTYRLRVQSSNSDGIWSPHELALTVVIRKAYWQTWPFRLGVALVLLLLVRGIYTSRTRLIRQHNTALTTSNEQLQNEVKQRRLMTHQLRKHEAELLDAQELAELGSFALNLRHGQIELSPGASKLLGFAFAPWALSVRQALRHICPTSRALLFRELRNARAAQLDYIQPEIRIIRQDGTYRWFLCRARLEQEPDSQELDIIRGTLLDITDPKLAALHLRKALTKEQELNQLKTRFISLVSHEFRTPLAVILNAANLLQRYEKRLTSQQRHSYFAKIEESIADMTSMLEDVLWLGRTDTERFTFAPEPTDFRAFLEDQVETFERAHRVPNPIVFHPPPHAVIASVDPRLMRQAFNNVLTNAVKYTLSAAPVFITLETDANGLTLIVRDQGIGIPPDDLPHLFEPFHRAGNVDTIRGTGLGLSLVKRIVDLHQGHIGITSHVGQGTTFRMVLPLTQETPTREVGRAPRVPSIG